MRVNNLLIDIDNKELKDEQVRERVARVVYTLWPTAKCLTVNCWVSPSGRGLHVIAKFSLPGPAPPHKIILAQLLCYSDVNREMANLSRVHAGVKEWNRLFSTQRERLVEDGTSEAVLCPAGSDKKGARVLDS